MNTYNYICVCVPAVCVYVNTYKKSLIIRN